MKHWINLDLFTKLEKPYFIFLDSDKPDAATPSENHIQLAAYGLTDGTDFFITKKRLLENYIHHTALMRLVPGSIFAYGDFEHVKNLCKNYADQGLRGHIGGKNVAEKHYSSLTFDDLRMTWFDGTADEFLELYYIVRGKIA